MSARVWLVGSLLLMLVRAAGFISSIPLTVFLVSVLGAICWASMAAGRGHGSRPTLVVRRTTILLLIVSIPVLIDPHTSEVFNIPRLFFVCIGAVVVAATWVVDWAWTGRRPRWLNGLQWACLSVLAWTAVTTATSILPRVSLSGAYGSYEGLELMAALVTLAFGLADSFALEDLPLVMQSVVVGAGPVLVYALIQMHDYVLGGHWDFIGWRQSYHNAFATFGNPNHLAGYLATILPLAVVLAVQAGDRTRRATLALTSLVTAVVILQTACRGAWLATLVAAVVLAVGLWPRMRQPSFRVLAGAGLGAAVSIVLLVLGAQRFIGGKLSSLFAAGGNSSVEQRFGYWQAALRVAEHHPLVGTGPDTYSVIYARYQSAHLAASIKGYYVNGPHNLFLDFLSNQGFPGFVILVFLFATAFWACWAAFRLRRPRSGPGAEEVVDLGRAPSAPAGEGGGSGVTNAAGRQWAVALGASLMAFIVQFCFDASQVGTLFVGWMVLGAIGVLAAGTFSGADLLRFPRRPGFAYGSLGGSLDGVPEMTAARGRRRRRRQRVIPSGAVLAAVLGLAAVLLGAWRLDMLWRADHDMWASTHIAEAASVAAPARGLQATVLVQKAHSLNPWEPSYLLALAGLAVAAYEHPSSTSISKSEALSLAAGFDRQAVALDPYNTTPQTDYGSVLLTEAALTKNLGLLLRAEVHLKAALRDDPYYGAPAGYLRKLRAMYHG